ncbi:hypothetical protein KQI89_10830 [Clostridium sp. MSJ-4]|uniref:STAS domain-containing protein n=1 Tax=Clostridium simiarum TaxID=2841506 RepID=A0ABS6F177_9CLOT|nr:hypothetical protein [Clostridium simiarum]MBU5592257.1 hypothetical protein [Clostridium simiarum]
MYKISYSKEKNRIYIEISGKLSETDEQDYISEMLTCLNNVEPNFTVSANLQNCDISVLDKSSNFEVIRNYGKEKKLYKVAVILSVEAFNSNLSNPFKGLNNAFNNIKDAEHYLNS